MSADKDARIAELEAKLEHMSKLATPAAFTISENSRLRSKIAELERKLAEQQAVHLDFCKIYLGGDKYYKFHGHAPQEELNSLLAKAKEEEREMCAKICDHEAEGGANDGDVQWSKCGEFCADAIRKQSYAPKPQGETECQ